MSQIKVRSTISLPGLPLGAEPFVDPSDPYISMLIRNQYLVPLTPLAAASEEAPRPESDEDESTA